MGALKAVNLGVRFALELCALSALAYAGYRLPTATTVRWLLAVLLPVLAAATWGRYVAPASADQLADPLRFVVEAVIFAAAAAGLVAAQRPTLGWLLGVAFALNRLLLIIWDQ